MHSPNGSLHVLLIDDNEIDNFINKKLIEKTGFAEKVDECRSGIAGLEYLRACEKGERPAPSIVFLDIMMPVMDGFEFLEEYEKLSPALREKIRVIMLSSTESFKDLNRANSNKNIFKFLNKPLSEPVLNAIQKAPFV